MGFIHQTNSEILGFEERNESATLSDITDNAQELFFHYTTTKAKVQKEIAERIMEQAGDAFSLSDFTKAAGLKKIADIVLSVNLTEQTRARSFEATFDWLAALVNFLGAPENAKLKAKILAKNK